MLGVVGFGLGVMGVMGSRHKFVRGSRSPCKTRHLLCQMLHVVFVNVAVHPASQRVLMEMSDEWESPGTMWARVATVGVLECLDCMCGWIVGQNRRGW